MTYIKCSPHVYTVAKIQRFGSIILLKSCLILHKNAYNSSLIGSSFLYILKAVKWSFHLVCDSLECINCLNLAFVHNL